MQGRPATVCLVEAQRPDGQRVVAAAGGSDNDNRDIRNDILLLAELAEATGGQAENLKLLTLEHVRASLGEDRWEILEPVFENDCLKAIHEMERLGPQKPDDFSVFASGSFRMGGE